MKLLPILIVASCVTSWAAMAQPRTDCGAAADPTDRDVLPRVEIFFGGELEDWTPPPCTGWEARPFTVMVQTQGLTTQAETGDAILERLGRVSEYTSIRYWSTTRRRWRELVTAASALSEADPAARRSDFSAVELRAGPRFFRQEENTPLDDVTYRLDIGEPDATTIVARFQNALKARASIFETLPPGAHEFLYVLRRQEDGRWRIYGLSRTGNGPNRLASAGRKSYGNRAVALYRHLAGEATDGADPLFP